MSKTHLQLKPPPTEKAMKSLLLSLSFAACCFSANAWTVKEYTDPITDQIRKEVTVTSDEGHAFTLVRKSDNRVWAYLRLSPPNQFMVGERLTLRIDKDKPINFNEDLHLLMKKMGRPISAWEWNPSLIGFLFWHGDTSQGCGLIKRLMESSTIVIRYHPNQSTENDIFFTTTQDRDMIAKALNIQAAQCEK